MIAGRPPFAPGAEPAGVTRVERATVLADALAGRPVAEIATGSVVVDYAGHRRPVYRPLLAYAYRTASAVACVADPDVSHWVDEPVPIDSTAAAGDRVAAAAWSALATGDAKRFDRLVAEQQPDGGFLRATSSDNPETRWYHELVVLHAVADHAIRSNHPAAWAAVERATRFHLNETEPDHATGQPWGLPAFVRVAGAGPLADAALHAVAAHQPGGATGVALFLLADTVYGFRHAGPGHPGAAAEDVT